MNKVVTVVGTGTIGEPLIGLLTRHKKQFGIDKVIFFKNTPLSHDMSKVEQLISQGAELATDEKKFDKFREMGADPQWNRIECIAAADVVIDCTPDVMKGREFYESLAAPNKLMLAQGNSNGWGKPYARHINEKALTKKDNFVKIVSCNTHTIARLTQVLNNMGTLNQANYLCIRRANDISQNGGITPSIEVGGGKSHHARDASDLFKTLNIYHSISSAACKINSQYMHVVYFDAEVYVDKVNDENVAKDKFLNILREDRKVTLTEKTTANKVFSFGRDYGYYGRILTQAVICEPSICVQNNSDNCTFDISGFAFTPQDGNSLASSLAATLWHIHDKDWKEVERRMDILKPYFFQKI